MILQIPMQIPIIGIGPLKTPTYHCDLSYDVSVRLGLAK